MKNNGYAKGNLMTFPLELTQAAEETNVIKNNYLYPVEVLEIQEVIQEYCDRMEYDGSMMYDEYPDKVCVERLAKRVCRESNCRDKDKISPRWMEILTQIMLCNEMSYRRERRRCHKKNLSL